MAETLGEGGRSDQVSSGAEMVFALTGACWRAWRAGDLTVRSDHVLLELTARSAALRRHVGPASAVRARMLSSAAGGELESAQQLPLTQHHALEVNAALRESVWRARRRLRLVGTVSAPAWSSETEAAVGEALRIAQRYDVIRANHVHLLLGLTVNRRNAACTTLREMKVDIGDLLSDSSVRKASRSDGELASEAILALRIFGGLAGPRPLILRWFSDIAEKAKPGQHGPLLYALRREAIRQAARAGAAAIADVHLLAAILCVEEDLESTGRQLHMDYSGRRSMASVLRANGVAALALYEAIQYSAVDQPAAGVRRVWRGERADPPFAASFLDVVDRAGRRLAASDNGRIGLRHLLGVLFHEGMAGFRLLVECGIETRTVRRIVEELGVAS